MREPHDAVRGDVQDCVRETKIDQPAGVLLGTERPPELFKRRPFKHRDQSNQRDQLVRQRCDPCTHELPQRIRYRQRRARAAAGP